MTAVNALTIAAHDSATMLGRELKHTLRLFRLLFIGAILVPVVMLLLVGFRPKASAWDWLGVIGIVAAFSFALAWLSAALGMVAKSAAGANGATLPIQFLLPFLSSTFVPASTMPAGVRWFAEHQPFT